MTEIHRTMSYRLFRVAGVLSLAVWLLSTPLEFAEGNEAKPADEPPPAAEEPAKEPLQIDEFTETERAITRPASNPECVWLGRNVVSLLWRDDLDTALRNLDFYDRLGCPSRHIQASFRCLILHGSNLDPKAADRLNTRILACWINPAAPAMLPPAAVEASPTTDR